LPLDTAAAAAAAPPPSLVELLAVNNPTGGDLPAATRRHTLSSNLHMSAYQTCMT
jgi:hypothetical protein